MNGDPRPRAHSSGLQPFFLEATRGRLFCLLHEPAVDESRDSGPHHGSQPTGVRPERGAASQHAPVLFLPPFAEEMNKARRMISLQARALAAAGHRVLIPDLYGTGDSDGDFADASWETWIQDLTLLRRWLQERDGLPPCFWSLRTGALLGAELTATEAPPQWLLWQPVVNGQQFFTQFLRLKVAAEMTGTGPPVDTRALRAELSAGSSVEIAGYEVPGPLAVALDSKTLSATTLARVPRVGWFEVTTSTTPSLSPVAKKVIDECRAHGASDASHGQVASSDAQVIDAQAVQGQPFWSTPEITLAPELLEASSRFLAGASTAASSGFAS